ncbi:MAG TPA: hypothetical protein VJU78_12855 [Chitinophagaceae bacterium]|nr:hypothetical protein [Chitinophagaceae bacterium]
MTNYLTTITVPLAVSDSGIMSEKISVQHQLLKRGIWAYFILLVFEGALRKWFLPGLSTPLLIVRDPIALLLLLKAAKDGILPANVFMSSSILVGIVGLFTAIFLGHGNLAVALFGTRIFILHFPLIFVIGTIFNREDVIKMGKVLVWISIPMALLIAVQFYSPQSAWVNRGVGGDINGAGFSGALGFFRPPGTFSFTNGNALFFSLVASFLIYFWLNPKDINRLVLFIATIGLIAAIPLSISRNLFFSIIVSMIFALFAILKKPQYIGRVVLIGIVVLLSLGILSNTSFFQTSVEAFTARFENANETEGGVSGVIGERYLGRMIGDITETSEIPFFGYGLGLGTNVGTMMLSGNTSYYLIIAEREWGRLVGELGPLLGILVIFMRLALATKMVLASYRKLITGDLLPWMLLSFGILLIPQGQWGQPTGLGFCVLIAGLIIATFNKK